jgi:PAS domain S-box-containing protein
MPGPLRVLLVEGPASGLSAWVGALGAAGYDLAKCGVHDAAGLRDALDRASWDLVFYEWGLKGLEASQVMRAIGERELDLPVMAVAEEGNQETALEAQKAGFRDCVLKKSLEPPMPVMVGFFREAAERRRRLVAEAALKDMEERHRSMLEASPDSIVIYDLQGRANYVNRSFSETFGWSADELLGKMIPYVPQQAEAATRRVTERMLGGEPVRHFETQRLTKDGRVLAVQLSSAMFRDREGRAAGNIVIIRDLSRRKAQEMEKAALEAQLRQSQKMQAIGTLAGGIAHDFNNILGVITGYSELALAKLQGGEGAEEEVSEVLVACQRAKELIKQILAFSRSTREERRPLMVAAIVKEVVKLLRASLPALIEIREDIASQGTIMGDPTGIHQLIMNLAANAGQAMRGQGGVLKISLHDAAPQALEHLAFSGLAPGNYLELTVSDTGPGVDPSIQGRIFEPFFTTKDLGEGTGMGLAVVHGIVLNHRGRIRLESQPGQGATFTVLLPRVEAAEQPASLERPAAPCGQESVLLVDDEEDLVLIGKRMLESLGYRVTALSSPGRALEIYQRQPDLFDCLVTDQTMPGLTGVQLASRIMAQRPGMPVVLCTGFSELITAEQAKALGISQFVMKPFVRFELAQAVRSALDGQLAAPS